MRADPENCRAACRARRTDVRHGPRAAPLGLLESRHRRHAEREPAVALCPAPDRSVREQRFHHAPRRVVMMTHQIDRQLPRRGGPARVSRTPGCVVALDDGRRKPAPRTADRRTRARSPSQPPPASQPVVGHLAQLAPSGGAPRRRAGREDSAVLFQPADDLAESRAAGAVERERVRSTRASSPSLTNVKPKSA